MNDYERALLGAVLNGLRELPTLTGDDFADPKHAVIWEASAALHGEGQTVNPLTVKDRLGSRVQQAGGPLYLVDLLGEPWTDPQWSASKVREGKIRRDIQGLGARCLQMVDDVDAAPEDLVAKIRVWADNIGTATTDLEDLDTAVDQVIDTAEYGEPAASHTPWSEIDELIGGFYPGQLITIGARPGQGKTLMLENSATHMARTGKRVLFCSLEMSQKEIIQRTMAHTAKVELTKLRRGRLDEGDWSRVRAARPVITSTPLTLVDNRRRQTLATIRAAAFDTSRLAKRNNEKFGGIFVDYCQLVIPRPDRNQNRQQQLGEITRGLKMLAGELEVPVVMGAQLNRAGGNRAGGVPILSDLREAGDIEQDSDVVMFLHEQEVEDGGRIVSTGDLDVIVAKQRSGPTGTRTLRKYGHFARIAS